MAETVSWDGLRELAEFRAEKGCAISLYLDLDPKTTPTAGDAATRVSSLLADGERHAEANNRGLTHDQRVALKDDFARIRDYFANEFERDGAHGVAVFSAGMDNVWRPRALIESVPDRVRVGREFHLTPLVPLVGRGEGAIVAFLSRERGELLRLHSGRLEEVVDHTDDVPGRHDQGGWSQSRYQRHIEKLVQDHLKDVAATLERSLRRLRRPRVVVVASEETRAELEEELSSEVKEAIIGWASAEAHATPAQLLHTVEPLLERWRADQETTAVERWREAAGRNGRAASGWAQTLEAASDGRVELLLFHDGADHHAWQCPACGRLAAEPGNCPLDGTQMEESRDGLDLAVHQTLAHGGTVWALRQRQDLDPVEGIGAVLRY
jgi:peptide chain release factor subunit 1